MFNPIDIGILAGVALLVCGPRISPKLNSTFRVKNVYAALELVKIADKIKNGLYDRLYPDKRGLYSLMVRPAARLSMLSMAFFASAQLIGLLIRSKCLNGSLIEIFFSVGMVLALIVFSFAFARASRFNFCQRFVVMPYQLIYWMIAMCIMLMAYGGKSTNNEFLIVFIVATIFATAVMLAFVSKFAMGFWTSPSPKI